MKNIAILIPTYNCERYIAETLESLANQDISRSDMPLIYVADDGSADDTVSVAEARLLELSLPCVRLFSSYNRGQWTNVNEAIAHLKQQRIDWVLILHADDVAKENWISTLVSRIEETDEQVGSICSSWDNFYPGGRISPGEDRPERAIERIHGDLNSVRGTLAKGCWWHISGCAMRLRTYADVGPFHPTMDIGDLEWLLRSLRKGWAIEYIPRTLIRYRQHTASVSSESFLRSRDITESLEILRRYRDVLTPSKILALHLKKCRTISVRFARALTRGQFTRMVHLLIVFSKVASNLYACLKSAKPEPHSRRVADAQNGSGDAEPTEFFKKEA